MRHGIRLTKFLIIFNVFFKMRRIVRLFSRIKYRFLLLLTFLRHYRNYINGTTFYPEKERKSKYEIFIDFVRHIIKYGELEESYFVLGIDVKGVNFDDYLTYNQYVIRRDKLNLTQPVNYVCLLRNKSLFAIVGEKWGMPVLSDLAQIENGEIKGLEGFTLRGLIEHYHHLFVKPIDGRKGEGIMGIDQENGRMLLNGVETTLSEVECRLQQLSNNKVLIVQKRIQQHPAIASFHAKSVNTLRVVTINHLYSSDPNDVVLVGAELRVGCGDSFTDNISAGGIKIGVNEDGLLQKYGFFRLPFGTKTTIHPDSKLAFENYPLPYYNETIHKCKLFHSMLKDIHLIGWDIAITEDGPVFIEGNDSCGTDFQVFNGPMKQYYDRYLPEKK